MKKVLLLTYAFSPHSTPESILSAKLFANTKDIETDVVTIEHPIPGTIDLDPSLEQYIKSNFNKIYRCKLNSIFKLISYLNLKRLFPFPDYFFLLNKSIYNYIINNIDINKYDYIITWSQSHSIHLVGLKLKSKYNLKNWISYFSDPWSDNPFFNTSYLGLEKYLNIINEKKVFKNSKKIICTSFETKELIGSKYSSEIKEKIEIIPHCFDKNLYNEDNNDVSFEKNNFNQIKIRYIGKFYGKRFPKVLIDALKIIENQNFNLFKKINIEVYGSQNFLVSLKLFFYKSYITLRGPISYTRSLKIMRKADYLLVLDAPFKESVFFPSKLVDYMGSNRTVIGITPKGTARKIIEEMGGIVMSHNDPKKLSLELIDLISSVNKPKINDKFIDQFSGESVSKKFSNILA